MKNLRAVIVDDEADAVDLLKLQLAKHCPEITEINTYTDSVKALENMELRSPDLVFLDIEMPMLNGFELLQKLMPFNFAVIFITAYNQYAIKAFKFNAIDYLVKPVDTADLVAAVSRLQKDHVLNQSRLNTLQKQMQGEAISKIAVSSQSGVFFIDLKDIIYAEADSNYTTLMLADGRTFVVSKTLKDLQDVLEDSHFLRVHRQYIINLNHVTHLDRTRSTLTMTDKKELPVARNQKDKLFEMYKWL